VQKSELPDSLDPFILDIKSSNPQYKLSSKGNDLLSLISSKEYSFNYLAFIDSYIQFKVTETTFEKLCNNGYFDIWEPGAPLKYFEGKDIGYLMLLRVYKLKESIPNNLLDKGRRGRNFYFKLTKPFIAEPEKAVLDDQIFDNHKIGLIETLKELGCFVNIKNHDYVDPVVSFYEEATLNQIFIEAEKKNESLSLKEIAEKINNKGERKKEIKVTYTSYYRDPDVSVLAKKRADGICDCCGKNAPFKREDGNPFLESHHLIPLSEQGEDSADNVCAVCPNCHRRLHFGEDRKALTSEIVKKLKARDLKI